MELKFTVQTKIQKPVAEVYDAVRDRATVRRPRAEDGGRSAHGIRRDDEERRRDHRHDQMASAKATHAGAVRRRGRGAGCHSSTSVQNARASAGASRSRTLPIGDWTTAST